MPLPSNNRQKPALHLSQRLHQPQSSRYNLSEKDERKQNLDRLRGGGYDGHSRFEDASHVHDMSDGGSEGYYEREYDTGVDRNLFKHMKMMVGMTYAIPALMILAGIIFVSAYVSEKSAATAWTGENTLSEAKSKLLDDDTYEISKAPSPDFSNLVPVPTTVVFSHNVPKIGDDKRKHVEDLITLSTTTYNRDNREPNNDGSGSFGDMGGLQVRYKVPAGTPTTAPWLAAQSSPVNLIWKYPAGTPTTAPWFEAQKSPVNLLWKFPVGTPTTAPWGAYQKKRIETIKEERKKIAGSPTNIMWKVPQGTPTSAPWKEYQDIRLREIVESTGLSPEEVRWEEPEQFYEQAYKQVTSPTNVMFKKAEGTPTTQPWAMSQAERLEEISKNVGNSPTNILWKYPAGVPTTQPWAMSQAERISEIVGHKVMNAPTNVMWKVAPGTPTSAPWIDYQRERLEEISRKTGLSHNSILWKYPAETPTTSPWADYKEEQKEEIKENPIQIPMVEGIFSGIDAYHPWEGRPVELPERKKNQSKVKNGNIEDALASITSKRTGKKESTTHKKKVGTISETHDAQVSQTVSLPEVLQIGAETLKPKATTNITTKGGKKAVVQYFEAPDTVTTGNNQFIEQNPSQSGTRVISKTPIRYGPPPLISYDRRAPPRFSSPAQVSQIKNSMKPPNLNNTGIPFPQQNFILPRIPAVSTAPLEPQNIPVQSQIAATPMSPKNNVAFTPPKNVAPNSTATPVQQLQPQTIGTQGLSIPIATQNNFESMNNLESPSANKVLIAQGTKDAIAPIANEIPISPNTKLNMEGEGNDMQVSLSNHNPPVTTAESTSNGKHYPESKPISQNTATPIEATPTLSISGNATSAIETKSTTTESNQQSASSEGTAKVDKETVEKSDTPASIDTNSGGELKVEEGNNLNNSSVKSNELPLSTESTVAANESDVQSTKMDEKESETTYDQDSAYVAPIISSLEAAPWEAIENNVTDASSNTESQTSESGQELSTEEVSISGNFSVSHNSSISNSTLLHNNSTTSNTTIFTEDFLYFANGTNYTHVYNITNDTDLIHPDVYADHIQVIDDIDSIMEQWEDNNTIVESMDHDMNFDTQLEEPEAVYHWVQADKALEVNDATIKENETETCPPPNMYAIEDYRAPSGEDEAIYEIYYSNPIKTCGNIVEIGAGDGSYLSKSYFFENALHWNSLLIEANPEAYHALEQNRKKAKTVYGGFCSGKKLESESSNITNVPCLNLVDVFKKQGITKIDIMYIAVTGDVLSVIEKMDWTVKVDIWVIELGGNEDKNDEVRSVLNDNDYVKAEWDIKRWCSNDMKGRCMPNEVFLARGYNPLPKDVSRRLTEVQSRRRLRATESSTRGYLRH